MTYKWLFSHKFLIFFLQVSASDRLSLNICHACISYLNSWQSFKNRCDAAQRKQKIWLSNTSAEGGSGNSKVQSTGQSLLKNQLNGFHGNHQLKPAIVNEQQKFQEKQAELQRQKLQELVLRNQQQKSNNDIDTSFIKSEPASDDVSVKYIFFLTSKHNFYTLKKKCFILKEEENVMELDPSQFLAQGSSGDDESDIEEGGANNRMGLPNGNGPPILTSLGLTHINSVQNPYSSYAVSLKKSNILKNNIIFFRIRMIQQTMTRVKYRVKVAISMLKYQPIAPFAICNFRIVPMPVATRRISTKFDRVNSYRLAIRESNKICSNNNRL